MLGHFGVDGETWRGGPNPGIAASSASLQQGHSCLDTLVGMEDMVKFMSYAVLSLLNDVLYLSLLLLLLLQMAKLCFEAVDSI